MGTSRRYDLGPEDLADWITGDGRARREAIVRAIQHVVSTEGSRIAQAAVDATDPKPVDRGVYRRSFEAYDLPNGAVLLNSAGYAGIIEEGRRPGRRPPVRAIELWVRRKFRLRFKEARFQRRVSRAVGERLGPRVEAQIRSMAFLIARAIGRRGLKGHHVMARVERELTPRVHAAMMLAARGEAFHE